MMGKEKRRSATWSSVVLRTALLCLILGSAVWADETELRFSGTLGKVVTDGSSIIMLVEIAGVQMPVRVEPDTLIELVDGDLGSVQDLASGVFVEATVVAAGSALSAEAVRVQEDNEAAAVKLHGEVEAKNTSASTFVVQRVTVTVNAKTQFNRVGYGKDEAGGKLTFADLKVGDPVKVIAYHDGNALVASVVLVGNLRGEHRILRFEGKIKEIKSSTELVVTTGTGDAGVLIDPRTKVIGNLVVGAEVFVLGKLNDQLKVVARMIRVKGAVEAGRGGSPRPDAGSFIRSARLRPLADGSKAEGRVTVLEVPQDAGWKRSLHVLVHHLDPSTPYEVWVDGVKLGTFSTNAGGQANVLFTTQVSEERGQATIQPLPSSFDVRSVRKVQIKKGATVVLEVTVS